MEPICVTAIYHYIVMEITDFKQCTRKKPSSGMTGKIVGKWHLQEADGTKI